MREFRSRTRPASPPRASRSSLIIGLLAAGLGVVLLMGNFYLLAGFNVTALWPLALVGLGGVLLLRGDLPAGDATRPFAITRGSVEAAALEVHAGEIDVRFHALPQTGRLIAGQYARDSQPRLTTDENRALLFFDRAATPYLSFADWELGLTRDLPWEIALTSTLGAVTLDLSGLIMQRGLIATGIGDITLTVPQEAFEPLMMRSSLGTIRVLTPPGAPVQITAQATRLFKIHADPARYDRFADDTYIARDADASRPAIRISVQGVFGDAYFA